MTPNFPISNELLARYLANELSVAEQQQVTSWLGESPEHKRELARFRTVWEKSNGLDNTIVDVDAGWATVQQRIKQVHTEPKIIPMTAPKRSIFGVHQWQWAAAVVTLLIVGWVAYQKLENAEPPVTAATVETQRNTRQQLLPDGTKVTLNQLSKLSYGDDFNAEARTVTLRGEAFFEVKRNETKPFIIRANGTEVRVLGTSFNVRAYDQQVRVSVESGKVQFSTLKRKVLLVKQQEAIATADTIIELLKLTPNAQAYRTKVFVFERTNLNEVVASLRDGYQTDIRLGNRRLSNCQLTARFERESLDNALTVIAETLQLKVTRQGNQIVLEGAGCP